MYLKLQQNPLLWAHCVVPFKLNRFYSNYRLIDGAINRSFSRKETITLNRNERNQNSIKKSEIIDRCGEENPIKHWLSSVFSTQHIIHSFDYLFLCWTIFIKHKLFFIDDGIYNIWFSSLDIFLHTIFHVRFSFSSFKYQTLWRFSFKYFFKQILLWILC